MKPTPWLRCPKPNPQAQLRLFCFHHAGGGAVTYNAWPAHLPHIEMCAVQLPGRESRIRETPFTRMEPLVQTLMTALAPYFDKPFAFFGHSMGSLVAYELAQALRRTAQPMPLHLFASGRRAPQLPDPHPPLHILPDDAFLAAIQQRYGGLPALVFQDAELKALFTPLLRADFTLVETYHASTTQPLACPLTAFGGESDHYTSHAELMAWGDLTNQAFALHILPGGHFYLNEQRPLLLTEIAAMLRFDAAVM
ncbi:MAG: thioesterase domain-containing protein [Caldilineaceae bacterium]